MNKSKEERNQEIFDTYHNSNLSMADIAASRGLSPSAVCLILSQFPSHKSRTCSDYRKHDYDKVAEFISSYFLENYRPPTTREISTEFNIPHGSTIVNMLASLAKEQKIIIIGKLAEPRRYAPAWLPKLLEKQETYELDNERDKHTKK